LGLDVLENKFKSIEKHLKYIDDKTYIKLKQNDSCDKHYCKNPVSEAVYVLNES